VYICSDKNFDWLSREDGSGTYIGFPQEDVFVFDEAALAEFNPPALWERLVPYHVRA